MYIQQDMSEKLGCFPKIMCNTSPIWVIAENGNDVIEIDARKEETAPFFKVESDVIIFTPTEDDPDLQQIANTLNNCNNVINNLRKKLEKAGATTCMSYVRTPWTALPNYGMPKGPIENFKNMRDMIEKAQRHNCSKRKISSLDNPRERMVGLSCMCGRHWQIGLVDIKRDLSQSKTKWNISSCESRKELANKIQMMQAIPEIPLDDKDDPGDGMNPFSIMYFSVLNMFGWKGDLSDISLKVS